MWRSCLQLADEGFRSWSQLTQLSTALPSLPYRGNEGKMSEHIWSVGLAAQHLTTPRENWYFHGAIFTPLGPLQIQCQESSKSRRRCL